MSMLVGKIWCLTVIFTLNLQQLLCAVPIVFSLHLIPFLSWRDLQKNTQHSTYYIYHVLFLYPSFLPMHPGNCTSLAKECYIWVSVSQQVGVACTEIHVWVEMNIHPSSQPYRTVKHLREWVEWSLFILVRLTLKCVFIFFSLIRGGFIIEVSFAHVGKMGFKGLCHK